MSSLAGCQAVASSSPPPDFAMAVSPSWLGAQLRKTAGRVDRESLFVLDCRPAADFACRYIQGSHNVTLPTILYKRLLRGILPAAAVLPVKDVRQHFERFSASATVVVVPDSALDDQSAKARVAHLLLKRLHDEQCDAYLLQGGFEPFRDQFADLCVSGGGGERKPSSDESKAAPRKRPERLSPLPSLHKLALAEVPTCESCSSGESEHSSAADESGALQLAMSPPSTPFLLPGCELYEKLGGARAAPSFPVQILPFLYLGNAQNAADRDTLRRYGIHCVLNVTPDLPNLFEKDDDFEYLQIPIDDHWSQNLAAFFPTAIAFIDEAREGHRGVLVHCLAGISRSVTVTVAYLMQTLGKSLDDAYDIVKRCKPNISPNFNFMGQLLDFERQLLGDRGSPDSGHFSADEPPPPPPLPFDLAISPTAAALPLRDPPRGRRTARLLTASR